MPYTREQIDDLFTYHPPDAEQIPHYEAVRAGAKAFAEVLVEHTPSCADQTAAMRALRECVMTANAAIARKGRPS